MMDANAGQPPGQTPRTTYYASKGEARRALTGDAGAAANRFFRDATTISQDFAIAMHTDGTIHLSFITPSRTPEYRKHYHQVIDSDGRVVREYKETWGPGGLVETKWLHGIPADE